MNRLQTFSCRENLVAEPSPRPKPFSSCSQPCSQALCVVEPLRQIACKPFALLNSFAEFVTEEELAALFADCGQVVDCRICGDPNSVLRFAFVEFTDEEGANAALSMSRTLLGFYPVRVLPSKTAIAPVDPKFLPRSEDEREMCTRTT
ncbi:polyadenylate-binding protein-interacting protein 10-like, partial [Phalaenopsis equestris]|uniref:polyadenylate-binding protein-interacting protein 10-like n=1 Tax=Phalaenopsis equestris TaxID=78828 RepID=UPI0009E3461E